MDGFKNIAMLHAHAQTAALALAGQFTAQAAQVRILGHHDLKHEERVILPALAKNGLETFDVHAVTGEYAAQAISATMNDENPSCTHCSIYAAKIGYCSGV